MPLSIQAGLWGLLSGSALVLGAAIAYFVSLPPRVIAAVMAFGSGVLISALSFDLMDEAYRTGGIVSTSMGFLAGAAVYTAANIIVSRRGAKHRKRSGHAPDARQQSADEGGWSRYRAGRSPRRHPRSHRDWRQSPVRGGRGHCGSGGGVPLQP